MLLRVLLLRVLLLRVLLLRIRLLWILWLWFGVRAAGEGQRDGCECEHEDWMGHGSRVCSHFQLRTFPGGTQAVFDVGSHHHDAIPRMVRLHVQDVSHELHE